MTDTRPGWTRTWLDVAEVVSRRSVCVNSSVGAVVADKNARVLATGYNGPPRGMLVTGPCSGWCPRAKGEGSGTADYSMCASIHAEVNALLRVDSTASEGGTMYVTRAPCINCARVIANSGLLNVVWQESPDDDERRAKETLVYLEMCGLRVRVATRPKEEAPE